MQDQYRIVESKYADVGIPDFVRSGTSFIRYNNPLLAIHVLLIWYKQAPRFVLLWAQALKNHDNVVDPKPNLGII